MQRVGTVDNAKRRIRQLANDAKQLRNNMMLIVIINLMLDTVDTRVLWLLTKVFPMNGPRLS